jgi:phosphatidate phosphatase APP1
VSLSGEMRCHVHLDTVSRRTRSVGRPFATRIDDWVHAKRQKHARRRGKRATIIPAIGYGGEGWVRVLGRVLYLTDSPPTHMQLNSVDVVSTRVRGWRSFTSVHVPYEEVTVSDGDTILSTVNADRGGVIDARISTNLAPGWHSLTLTSAHGDSAQAPVYIVDNSVRFGIISDVDDTVLNTVMPRPFVAAWNSFVVDQHARLATPGMPVLLDHLASHYPGSPVMYLSTGAWNVAPALSRFFARHLYPMGPMLLTDWGPTHDRWFRSGSDHKRQELSRLIQEFPDIKWVLFGDDGQHDEKIYHEFSSRHSDHIAAVAIRQLSVGEAVLAGGRSKAKMHRAVSGVPWIYGPDGATLREQFVDLGLLDTI